jgi:5-methylcytosine-specific restriction endonuclease McrA
MPKNNGSKWIRPEKRRAIYERDDFRCVYCGKGIEDEIMLTLDHVIPSELGGSNDHWNLITACISCNSSKKDLSLSQFLSYLKQKNINTDGIAKRIRRQIRRIIRINGKSKRREGCNCRQK